jgi:hypothetical protein
VATYPVEYLKTASGSFYRNPPLLTLVVTGHDFGCAHFFATDEQSKGTVHK